MATWDNMICERIKDLMKEKALSQKELCEQTNMIQSSCNIEWETKSHADNR